MQKFSKYIWKLIQGFGTVFATWPYRFLAFITSIIFLSLSILVPLLFIPTDTLSLVFNSIKPLNYVALILLAIISGIIVSANIFLFKEKSVNTSATGAGGFGVIASFLGAVLTTSCGCGLGFILAIFGIGIGGVSFLIANQLAITVGAIVISLIGLYLTMKRVSGICTTCRV